MKTNISIKVAILSFIVFLSGNIAAQQLYQIKGNIFKCPEPKANCAKVILIDEQNQQIVSTTICDRNGKFLISDIEKGEYLLMVVKPQHNKVDTRRIKINEDGQVFTQSSDSTLNYYAQSLTKSRF